MPETKKEQLTEILQNLRKIGDIQGSSVISRDGLVIASDLPKDVDEETFAAMQGSAETAVSELKQGTLNQIIIDANKGKIITISAGEVTILVALTKPNISRGLVLLEMEKEATLLIQVNLAGVMASESRIGE